MGTVRNPRRQAMESLRSYVSNKNTSVGIGADAAFVCFEGGFEVFSSSSNVVNGSEIWQGPLADDYEVAVQDGMSNLEDCFTDLLSKIDRDIDSAFEYVDEFGPDAIWP